MTTYEIPNGIGWRPDPDTDMGKPTYEQPEPFTPPSVTAPAVRHDGTALENAQAAMLNAVKEFGKHLDTVERDRSNYTDDGYRAQIAKFQDTAAVKAVDTSIENVHAYRDKAQADLDRIRHNLSPDGDTAAELRATRYWDRSRRLLDNTEGAGVMARAQQLIREASRPELGTLIQELPAYIESRGGTTAWIDLTIGQHAPEYGEARRRLIKAEQAVQVANSLGQMTKRALQGNRASLNVVRKSLAGARYNAYDPAK